MTAATTMRLGRMLVAAGVITDEQLAEAVAGADGRPLPHVLEELGFASETRVAQAIAESMGLAFVDIGAYDIDPNAALLLSNDLMRKYTVLPIKIQDDDLVVAMADPANIFAIDDLRIVTRQGDPPGRRGRERPGLGDRPVLGRPHQRQRHGRRSRAGSDRRPTDESTRRPRARSPAVARFMNQVITEAIRQGAGDIYIEPMETELRVRYRIDGVCQEITRMPRKMHRQLISRLKISSGMDIAERRVPQDGRFGVVLDGKSVDFRVAVLPIVSRRAGRPATAAPRLDHDVAQGPRLPRVQHARRCSTRWRLPYGAILVTGPTGSGKSTTLYAAINETNDPKSNLITVEDPVEYRLAGLSQVQVHEKAGMTFAAALRSILRQDPDKVMIGEIRDKETGTIAIEAALTGHLVLSTLHTNDAPSAITRLTEMGIEPFLSASAVTLVLAQRLARRLCPECKEKYIPEEAALEQDRVPLRARATRHRCTARAAARSAAASATRAGWASTRS